MHGCVFMICTLLAMPDLISFLLFIISVYSYMHCHDICSSSQHVNNCVPFALLFTDLTWSIMLPTLAALSDSTPCQICHVLHWPYMIYHAAYDLHWLILFPDLCPLLTSVIPVFSQCITYDLWYPWWCPLCDFLYMCIVWFGPSLQPCIIVCPCSSWFT